MLPILILKGKILYHISNFTASIVFSSLIMLRLLPFLNLYKMLQITEHSAEGVVSPQLDQQQVLAFLQGKYVFDINFFVLNAFSFLQMTMSYGTLQPHSFLGYIFFCHRYNPFTLISLSQRNMSQFMQNGQRKDVLFVDGWKIGMITK